MEPVKRDIEHKIFTIRGVQVMLDSDLAEMYQVEIKVINQAVKRNSNRFPINFHFQLVSAEWDSLRSQFVTLEQGMGKHRKYLPYAFTEQGVAMLSAVLRSDVAVQISVQIIQAFVTMRKTMGQLQSVIQRLEGVELKQLHTDNKLELLFKALERDIVPKQGIFFEGQLFDAHVFASDLIKLARSSIELVDNYVDETTLLLLSKRTKGVSCKVHTRIREVLKNDLEKYNKQYPAIELIENRGSHDRFLVIDDIQLYHFGASLKDVGKKCFAFSRMDNLLIDLKNYLLKNGK